MFKCLFQRKAKPCPIQLFDDELEALQQRTRVRQREAFEKARREGKLCLDGYKPPETPILTTFMASRQQRESAAE